MRILQHLKLNKKESTTVLKLFSYDNLCKSSYYRPTVLTTSYCFPLSTVLQNDGVNCEGMALLAGHHYWGRDDRSSAGKAKSQYYVVLI